MMRHVEFVTARISPSFFWQPRLIATSFAPSLPEAPPGRGSGFVISEDGYILTNNHVVEDAEKITVRFKDSKSFTATVKGRDPQSDLAVIKIDAKGLTPAKMGDSDTTRVGEFVIAVGAPFALDYSVTIGHVSAKGRSVILDPVAGDQDFIQTDASINPGNSGGPLVNLYGEVIGINSMIRGMNTGIGFAIPSNLAKQVMPRLMQDGKFTRARIGVVICGLREVQDYKLKRRDRGWRRGVRIAQDGPAEKSDLKAGDIIVAVDGKPVKTARELKDEIAYKKAARCHIGCGADRFRPEGEKFEDQSEDRPISGRRGSGGQRRTKAKVLLNQPISGSPSGR